MGIGVSIFLMALGAILTFAVKGSVSGLDIPAVGVILMIVGALGLILDFLIFAPRRRVVGYDRAAVAPVRRSTVVDEEVL